MSCRHVLSSETQRSEVPQQFGLDVVLRTDVRRKVAETLRIAGPLVDSPAISLDSQLMSVTEAGEFVAALGEVRITGVVRDDDELDTLLIQAGDRDMASRMAMSVREVLEPGEVKGLCNGRPGASRRSRGGGPPARRQALPRQIAPLVVSPVNGPSPTVVRHLPSPPRTLRAITQDGESATDAG